MRICLPFLLLLGIIAGANLFVPSAYSDCPGSLTVTNMVPYIRSEETSEDSEPSLAVNFADPFELVGTAFTPAPLGETNAPIYFSIDGGSTWTLNQILIGNESSSGTNDVSVSFGGMSGNLYAAIIEANTNKKMHVLFTSDFTSGSVMESLTSRDSMDQPHLVAVTAWGGSATGQDLVYVTSKDFAANYETSTLDHSLQTPLPSTSSFKVHRLEEAASCEEGGVSVISVPQLSGRVYAAFVRWKTPCDTDPVHTADLVVLRDDDWGVGPDIFTKLKEGSIKGRVAIANFPDLWSSISSQRLMSKVAIAVSPRNDKLVFLAWGQGSSADAYELRFARSDDGGENWTPIGSAIPRATNPALAVNIHGVVAFLYQQHVETVVSGTPIMRWETHLRISEDNLATFSSDETLASIPDPGFLINDPGPLGDYLQLTAVGKNFYGVFSSRNNPYLEYFPSGVVYQRRVNWETHKLLKLLADEDSTAPEDSVPVSTDPFFFKKETISPECDFYVRDWTLSPLLADAGLEPSSQREFYVTSDVWNRQTEDPGTFINDQPQSEIASSGLGTLGQNWAFARIRRNATQSSGSETVKAHFLVSKFGTGSNFIDINDTDPDVTFPDPIDPEVVFAANEMGPFVTTPFPWHLGVASSPHLCLAVEIWSSDDPMVRPSLRGNNPGWASETDLRITYDNNKAQRNMQVIYYSMEMLKSLKVSAFAIIHNGAPFRRDITIRHDDLPEELRPFPKRIIEVIGGHGALRPGGEIVLKDMDPGENRWIGFNPEFVGVRPGPTMRTPPPVRAFHFYEMLGAQPANGFAFGVQAVPATELYPENLRMHAALFHRPPLGGLRDSRLPADGADPRAYLRFLAQFLGTWGAQSPGFLDSLGFGDPFHLRTAAKDLSKAVSRNDAPSAATLHRSFMNRLDSFATMVELSTGDLADILQNVRWQEEIFQKSPRWQTDRCRDSILDFSQTFIRDYSQRTVGNEEYPEHIRAVLPCLRSIAGSAGKPRSQLLEACDRMESNLADPKALQRAHRDYLLELQRLN